ncbi:MAG: hypothetical protein R2867_44525 [Caldilineaceae bacterium]
MLNSSAGIGKIVVGINLIDILPHGNVLTALANIGADMITRRSFITDVHNFDPKVSSV